MKTTHPSRDTGTGTNRRPRAFPVAWSAGVLLGLGAGPWVASGCASGSGSSLGSQAFGTIDPLDGGFPGDPDVGSGGRPSFGATVRASVPPPPISGGTLLALTDGQRAVAADPDRDKVYVVNLTSLTLEHSIDLSAGDEPGRIIEDGAGRVHVALRNSGMLTTIDPVGGTVVSRRHACPAPRGVAWDSTTDLVWVACATGEIVALPAAGGSATQQLTVERDLRDVFVNGGEITVTKFRSAEVLRVTSGGTVSRRDSLPSPMSPFQPHVAWRTVAGPSGTVLAVHQAESTGPLQTTVQGGYGGGSGGGSSSSGGFGGPCFGTVAIQSNQLANLDAADDGGIGSAGGAEAGGTSGGGTTFQACAQFGPSSPEGQGCLPPPGAVMSVLTALASDGSTLLNTEIPGVLPVDVALSPDGQWIAVAAPGNAYVTGQTSVLRFTSCGVPIETSTLAASSQPIAVAFDAGGDLLVQTRNPAQLVVMAASGSQSTIATIALSSIPRSDTGLDIFHTQAGGAIACASCHPEGRDDGHVWALDGNQRRTPSLRGTIAGTAPYHWPGDKKDFKNLADDVYTVRMDGATLASDQMSALGGWVESIPAPPAPSWVDRNSAARGSVIFHRVDVGCSACHSGSKYTNNMTIDVGTGGAFQVPPLVGVGWREPLMHAGCAITIADRFRACSTPGHGSIGSLSTQDIADLTAYLQQL